jgi:drug/metabolite transporter (DMT)-like permease
VLPNLTPVLVTLAGWMFLRETPSRFFIIGMAGAVGGAVLMALASPGAGARGAHPHLGDILCASTAVWYGLYFLAVRRARASRSTLQVMLWSSLVGAPILLAIAIALGEAILPIKPWGWAALAGLGVAHVAGQGSIAWALGRLSASTAALVVLIQPVAAAGLAWLLFSEQLSVLQGVGGFLALAGVAFAQIATRTRTPPAA